jgi:hypothetical protein
MCLLTYNLSVLKDGSIGLRSGEYSSKNSSWIPTPIHSSFTRSEWWILALSRTIIWLGRSCGSSVCSNHSSNRSIVIAPSTMRGPSRYPSYERAGNTLYWVDLVRRWMSKHGIPISDHLRFLSPVLGAQALSSIKISCSGRQSSLFTRQWARSSVLRC